MLFDYPKEMYKPLLVLFGLSKSPQRIKYVLKDLQRILALLLFELRYLTQKMLSHQYVK